MSHDVSVRICHRPKFNHLSIADFNVEKYIPADYERRTWEENQKKLRRSQKDLLNLPAPVWTLNNEDSIAVSLDDFKNKVLIINITGIGCGYCLASIPFLKQLKAEYGMDNKLEIIGIESWSRRESAVREYNRSKKFNYPMLVGTQKVIDDYQTGGSAPWFFILDEKRIVRKVVRGYSKGKTDIDILLAVEGLLKEHKKE